MIREEDLSVVVQGDLHPAYTRLCIDSIRHYLPHAELILSTWEGRDASPYAADITVTSEDPGAVPLSRENDFTNNLNREIVSSRAGIARATRPYVLKFRTDMCLAGTRFLARYDERMPAEFFHGRVMILDHYTRNPNVIPVPFHPSDWILLGRRDDLAAMFDIPCMPREEMLYYAAHPNPAPLYRASYHRYTPEQWICLAYLRQRLAISCDHYADNTEENRRLTERILAGSYLVLDYAASDMRFLKYDPDWDKAACTLVHEREWRWMAERLAKGRLQPQGREALFYAGAKALVALRRIAAQIVRALGLRAAIERLLKGTTQR